MGCGSSSGSQGTEATRMANKSIQEKIMLQADTEKEAVKVLLLGAGECGKSTILKQMKILHMDGFDDAELAQVKSLVFKNTLDSIQALCQACKDLKIEWGDAANKEKAEKLLAVDSSAEIDLALAADIKACWADPACKTAKSRENEFHLLDSAKYFLNKIDETFTESFVPGTQDALRVRLTTTGIIETSFTLEGMVFKMYDVGGQRGERKKWIHCFDDVTAIMYIASLSEYNQVLAEDRNKNRLEESLTLFEGIANLPWFEKASIILFLNKDDLFREKVVKIDIGDYHKDYTGGLDYDAGIEYIKNEYIDRNEDEEKTLYCHVTDATNTENVQFVWGATQHIILKGKLSSSGLQM